MSLFDGDFDGEIEKAEHAARRLMTAFGAGQPGATATNTGIHIHAGGLGVWMATTACLVMLGALVVGALWVSREFARYDAQIAELRANDQRQADYLAAIYAQAPSLRPAQDRKNSP